MNNYTEWMLVQISSFRNVTDSVREFRLIYPEQHNFKTGSHVDVEVTIAGKPDRRSYSIVNIDDDGGVYIAVKRLDKGRGGSKYMWTLSAGCCLRATAPISEFELSRGAPCYLLLAGGIGVTPILSMARELVVRGADVRMVYAVRSRAELAYLDELRTILDVRLEVFVTEEGQTIDIAREIAALPAGGETYLCGPISLMDATRTEWARQGRRAAQLRFETFGSSGHALSRAFTVKIPRLMMEVEVPSDRSMLDALREAGVAVIAECLRGECGLCTVEVISADAPIDHRDVFLGIKEQARDKRMCACVSRATGETISIETAWRGDPDFSQIEVLNAR